MEMNLTLAHFYMFLSAFGGGLIGYFIGRTSLISAVAADVHSLKAAVFAPTVVVPAVVTPTPPVV